MPIPTATTQPTVPTPYPPAHLSDWGVLSVTGDDACTFLQGQLTNDVALMPVATACLAGYCSAKGRLLASFVVLKRAPNDFLLLLSKDLLEPTAKRLKMFIMRAKCTLADESANWDLLGEQTAETSDALHQMPAWSVAFENTETLIRLPSANVAQGLRLRPAEPSSDAPVVSNESDASTALAIWHFNRALSGVAMVVSATVESFVPQMLNYESTQGVSFKKGCYPGQEIVARSQFRGAIKRRAAVFVAADPSHSLALAVGHEVFSRDEDGVWQACGLVAAVGYNPQLAAWGLTVSLQLTHANDALTVGNPDGIALTPQPLPYEILLDI